MSVVVSAIISIVSSLVATGGLGIFFWSYIKRREKSKTELQESEARKAVAQADVAEDSAFSQRIAFLAEQLKQSNADAEKQIGKIRELNNHVDELERNVDELTKALEKANKIIAEKDEYIAGLEKELDLQIQKNAILARRTSHTKSEITRMKNSDKAKENEE